MSKEGNHQGPQRVGALSRRSFLRRAAATTAAAVAAPMIIPASALGLNGKTAPSNRIVMASIGVGSQGTGNLGSFLKKGDRVHVVAVCDVDQAHRERAQKIVNDTYENQNCKAYLDFRELLEKEKLDAVSIAVPDHWHSIPAIACAEHKLNIYAEKPLALTIWEGKEMVDAVRRNKVVWQTGSWQRSKTNFRKGCELVRNGRIGKVHTVKVGLPTGSAIAPQPVMPVPPSLDYERWLGPAPWAPYTEKRCHWNFRWIYDYSGGQLTDWAAHHCDIANWGMGTEYTGPESVEGHGVYPDDGLWNTAINYTLEVKFGKFASPVAPDGFTMIVADQKTHPMGARFEGDLGWIYVDRGDKLEASSPELLNDPLPTNATKLYESNDHFGNFLECVNSTKPTITPIEPAHRAISIAHLGNISMRLGRRIQWDAKNEHIVGDDTANRMLRRSMRGEWCIPVA
jgi:predicted dehydrogenase